MRTFLRLIVAILGWLLVATFAGAYAGYYVHPDWLWWLQVLALGLPMITVLLVPMTIVAFVVNRRRLAVVLLVALVLFGLRHAPFGLLDTREPIDESTSLRVLTFNTQGGKAYSPGADSGVVAIVEEYKPDLVCLQEFGAIESNGRPGTPIRSLVSMGYRQAATIPPDRRETQRPVVSRFPVVSTEYLPLTGGVESYALRAVLRGDAGEFGVYNVHLKGFSSARPWRDGRNVLDPRNWARFFRTSGGAYIVRAREAAKLRQYLEEETLPFLVCGDFNSTSDQWTYHHIADDLKDAFEIAGDGWGKTYHARIPVVRIDYILTSKDWDVHAAEVLKRGASDHRPVIAELGLRQNRGSP